MKITEEDVEKALHRLRVTTKTAAVAKGQVVLMEGFVKRAKAQAVAKQTGVSATAANELAYASDEYKSALEAYSAAVEIYEDLKLERETAMAWVECWRTLEASMRQTDRGHR